MLKSLGYFASALALAAPSVVFAKDETAMMFGMRESVEDIDISPDGKSILYLTPGPGASTVVLASKLDGEPKPVLSSTGKPDRLHWCKFVSNTRIVCQVSALVEQVGYLIPFARMVSLDMDGGNVTQLGQRASFNDARLRQFDGSVLDWLPQDGGAILMNREYIPEAGMIGTRLARDKNGLGVDRIDVRTTKASQVEPPSKVASDYMSDGRGNVRIMEVRRSERGTSQQLTSLYEYFYRPTGSKEWKPFGTYDSNTRVGMIPLAIDAEVDSVYTLKKLEGRWALYRVKLDGSMATDLAYANPKVDVDDVVRIAEGDRIIGVTFAEERRHEVYFDPEYKALAESLSKALPNLPLVQFAGSSRDHNTLLIYAGSDADPGRYYVFDKPSKKLAEVVVARPALEKSRLANVKAVSYPASDGTMVPAYLTVPAGKEAKNLPAIVLPHGGPSARDEWGFDWLSQFLAAKGYAVLQPNYRGSSGYGDEWLAQNGFRSWRTSIGDITAGAKWLGSEGIAAPGKLAILGWSYGGYAALQSSVVEPDLYKAVVAIAPVTDFQMTKDESRGFTNERLVKNYIGSGPHVVEGSPLRNVAAIKAPVLMFHGDQDRNVAIDQSDKMQAALKAAGKKSELVRYRDLEHSLVDSQVRVQMLEKIGVFLDGAMK
ncbi:S9 family peptidase [Allosphingosinicella indica]|uniref:Dipeptidyl aminopeptidase/acylaminoacyl peptidase n=1 Tax=Allosphingosinicella indica TaxID=941907 RepID=A0A1X7FYS7_9SPHN|nr:S9 family peptidase [Allosphingosinicella indica]SMF61280.1 Dipeptidyl aminopeptidase/acylaminoacyl peptidase [Allosphingosinicella indica]